MHRRRAGALLGLGLMVAVAHLWAGNTWLLHRADAARAGTAPALRRIEVAFVRDLLPAAPPAPPAARPAARLAAKRSTALRPAAAPAASSPAAAEAPVASVAPAAKEVPDEAPAPALEPSPSPLPDPLVAAVEAAASAPPAEPAVPAEPAFDWPPSTRLSYQLNGQYRGEVQGQASVEWLREGQRYQVHLQALVGPAALPLMARRLSSEGRLTPQGLVPQRLLGEQRIGFGTRRWALAFAPEGVTLANGSVQPAADGVQDEASQFVQLAWLFTTQPQRLVPGQSVSFPLALPRRLDRWVYDVVAEDTLDMPFGPLKAMHLKPRRAGLAGELTAQIWIAPTLQYLPVRILIHQDAQTYIDLMLDQPPRQAGVSPAPAR